MRRRRTAIAAALVALAGLVGGGWWVAGDHPRSTAAAAAPVAAQEKFVPYRDPAAGFAIDHPASWRAEAIDDGVCCTSAVRTRSASSAPCWPAGRCHEPRGHARVTDAVLSAPEAGLGVLEATATTLGGLPRGLLPLHLRCGGQPGRAHALVRLRRPDDVHAGLPSLARFRIRGTGTGLRRCRRLVPDPEVLMALRVPNRIPGRVSVMVVAVVALVATGLLVRTERNAAGIHRQDLEHRDRGGRDQQRHRFDPSAGGDQHPGRAGRRGIGAAGPTGRPHR